MGEFVIVRSGTLLAQINIMTIAHTLDRPPIICPSCRAAWGVSLVDPGNDSPFNWFRCDRCSRVFSSLRVTNPQWLAQRLVYPDCPAATVPLAVRPQRFPRTVAAGKRQAASHT